MIRIASILSALTLTFGSALSFLQSQNELLRLKLELPRAVAEIDLLAEEIAELGYLARQLESPSRLLALAELPEFSHLCSPDPARICVAIQVDPVSHDPTPAAASTSATIASTWPSLSIARP